MLAVNQTRELAVGQVLRHTSGKLRKVVALTDNSSGIAITTLTGTGPSFIPVEKLSEWTYIRAETHPGRGESNDPDAHTNAEAQSSVKVSRNASGKAVFEVKVYHVNPAFASGKAMELYDELVETYYPTETETETVTEPNAQ